MEANVEKKFVDVRLDGRKVAIKTNIRLQSHPDFRYLSNPQVSGGKTVEIDVSLTATNAFVLRYMLANLKPTITPEAAQALKIAADKVVLPQVGLSEDERFLHLKLPAIALYRDMPARLGAYDVTGGMRLSMGRLHDLEFLVDSMDSTLPKVAIPRSIRALISEPIPGFDGSLDSLKNIPISELNVVKANVVPYKAAKNSKPKSLAQRMEEFGIATLYDLLFWLPKRYIDKSNPQPLRSLLPDETAVITGTIASSSVVGGVGGTNFTIDIPGSTPLRVTFWRQNYLKKKFKVGQEVLITGKLGFYKDTPQLNGTSIEGAEEAALLPIVPVYKQSESRGITTTFLVSAMRELFSRIELIELPEYLKGDGRIDYYQALKELHLPSSLKKHRDVINSLAYYEMVTMQLIIQEQKEVSRSRPGIPQPKTSLNLQEEALKHLPFNLTRDQQKAVDEMNAKLADVIPSTSLLLADVGSGKTLVSQMACLRAVEAGYQAVLMGPTDVLSRQLHATFERLVAPMNNNPKTQVRIAYIGSGMKVAEKKKVLAAVKAGEVDVLVGTQSVISAVEYSNLGFVAVDEQQKFGAEQRSRLMNSRSDGRIPDIMMQTATPVPRSTAQVFYGDVDMIMLKDKPPGRLPIQTEWIQVDPFDIMNYLQDPLWEDVQHEASLGNQTFVITPLVKDQPLLDAASVEKTYETLKSKTLKNLRVGVVHGKMKKDEQQEVMQSFRDKKFDVLVASTVVEVGVDITDATRVIVMSAERLGSSSLHQIRGRVGRNSKQSKCYLVSSSESENSVRRLQSLVDFSDGFDVAQADLENRGEGTMFGENQSGAAEAIFASVTRHGQWTARAQQEARDILAGPLRDFALEHAREKFSVGDRLI